MKIRIKILIVSLVIVITTITNSQAQPYYQTTTTYDLGNGVTYKCDDDLGLITLYNSKNIYTYEDQTWADGGILTDVVDDYPSFTMTSESDIDIQNRVNSALTPAQKQIMGERTLAVSVIINPKTGKVAEVFFRFSKYSSPCTELPPSVFRQIELNFTGNPTIPGFKLVEIGPNLNYVMFTWAHQFK